MEIVKPSPEDFGQIAEIHNEAIKPFHDIYSIEEIAAFGNEMETTETVKQTVASREVLIAKDKGITQGYVSFRKKNDVVEWISSLYVHPQYQRQGIGERLIEVVEQIAIQNNCKLIALETHKDAAWAINFYKKHGYEIVNDKVNSYPYSQILDKLPAPNRPLIVKVLE